jgi:phosphate/sulfate permease
MAQFEELQQLWQRQPGRAMRSADAASLSHAFRRYGRRHDLIYLVKAMLIACQLIFLVTLLRDRPLALFWACVTDLSGILYMVSDWRAQRAIARLNFAEPSVAFLRSALARLYAQRNPFRTRQFLIAIAGIWMGGNLMVANLGPDMTLLSALSAHAVANVTMFAALFLGRWIRRKRFEKECRPLILRLEAVLQTMEADSI